MLVAARHYPRLLLYTMSYCNYVIQCKKNVEQPNNAVVLCKSRMLAVVVD